MLMRTSSETPARDQGAVLHLYRDLWQLLRGQCRIFVGAVVLLIGAQVVLLCVPYLSGRALNTLQLRGTAGLNQAALWLSLVLAAACVSWLLHGPGRILERRAALIIRQRMTTQLLSRLFELPLSWHESHHSGATAHRVQQSTHALSGFAQSQFIYLNSAVRLVGPLVALFWVQPVVGAAAVTGFVLIVLSVVGFDRAMLRLAHEENDAERRYSATLVDTLGNTSTVYALRQATPVAARLERYLLAVFIPLRKSIVLNEAKWCTVDLSTRMLNCCLVGLFVWLSTRAASAVVPGKALLLGSLYMVWEYAQQAAGVVASIASHFQTFARQHADYASAHVIRDTAAPASPKFDMPDATCWRRLAIRDLTFRHATNREAGPTLERLTFSLQRGKRYALIGASGSGKSTLLRVLAGLYPAERIALALDDGAIRVSSQEAAKILRAGATLIPQDAEVFEGTLGENLALCESVLGPPEPHAYAAALEGACATDFVPATPLGLETTIAERAANWSGGQRGRVALARGILAASGSALILLDEPTASLDPATEARVYSNLFNIFSGACVVSSIHRLSLLDRFDEVLVMREGKLIAQGTVAELTLSCPEFQRLASLQTGGTSLAACVACTLHPTKIPVAS
jgi:ABC-type multidrug transport system fused ATPase/permease subunit